ncbi:MAG: glycosyltransferase family 1 protein [Chloroflexi bacterium]|nr:glycosyltransferase family 1 protein [Chloroflexota bacterium]MDA1220005.1 glycosyltransferase family 1 protein [Chloroflexota bacterium]
MDSSNNSDRWESPRKIAIVSDAYYPQVNGVVRTLQMVSSHLTRLGHEVTMITPDQFRTVSCPTYPEIRLSLNAWPRVGKLLKDQQPDSIFIATEGPLGLAARQYCRSKGLKFTTSYSTRFPEYIRLRVPIPEDWSYKFFRWFHSGADAVMVPTDSLRRGLASKGIHNTALWSLGVDTELFKPSASDCFKGLPGPILIYVGRVAVEKNLEAFLSLPNGGSKVVVGDGPARVQLEKMFPEAVFVGEKHGQELADHYAAGDAFVFPSMTDTFGLVLLEALACGTPVAAFPVTGPLDVITDSKVGVLHEDLAQAVTQALTLNRQDCRAFALRSSWESCAGVLSHHLGDNRPVWNAPQSSKVSK